MNELLSIYQQRLNLPHALFSRIEHEDAMVAIVYKIIPPTGTPLILKICTRPSDYLREAYFLKYFAGELPVPQIVQLIPPEPDLPGAILMEYLPGRLLQITDFTPALAYELGSLLARIHLHRASAFGDLTQPEDLNSDPRVYFMQKFEEGFAESSDHLPNVLLEQCRQYYKTHIDLLKVVDGPCIIHRDFRPGNIIINEGKLQGIIDWASGRASFAEEDLCSLEYGTWVADPHHKKSFLAGYISIRPLPEYEALMPLLSLHKALATVGFTVKQNTWASTHAGIYKVSRQFMERFFKH